MTWMPAQLPLPWRYKAWDGEDDVEKKEGEEDDEDEEEEEVLAWSLLAMEKISSFLKPVKTYACHTRKKMTAEARALYGHDRAICPTASPM